MVPTLSFLPLLGLESQEPSTLNNKKINIEFNVEFMLVVVTRKKGKSKPDNNARISEIKTARHRRGKE